MSIKKYYTQELYNKMHEEFSKILRRRPEIYVEHTVDVALDMHDRMFELLKDEGITLSNEEDDLLYTLFRDVLEMISNGEYANYN